jgi:hypothetical protein
VIDLIVRDRLGGLVRLVDDVERAVAGERDLKQDGDEHQASPPTEHHSHAAVPSSRRLFETTLTGSSAVRQAQSTA